MEFLPGLQPFRNDRENTREFFYDNNGNLIQELNKGIISIIYNHLNLPYKIELENNRRIYYLYDANGTKLRKYFYEDNRLIETTDYSGMFVYKDDHIDYIQTSEGRMKWDDHDSVFYAEYFIKDHLGNVRDVITTNPNYSNPIIQVTDYYPFGLEIQEIGASDNLQLYNTKELQTDAKLWWYDYGARFYDPVLGRWHSVDPMAESSRRWSPYTYCMDNPIRFIDPDGMVVGDYYNKNGEYLGNDGKDDKKVYVADSKNDDGTFSNASDLGVTHDDFATSANVVKHESSGDKSESKWIAHTANNAKDNNAIDYNNQNETLNDQLTDQNYSTTPAEARTPLNDNDNSSDANNARAGVISVLSGEPDPTGGAVLWDGSDFLKNGETHNKFKEFTSITISASDLQTYSSAQKVTPASTFKAAIDGKTSYSGAGQGKYFSLQSSGAQGKSIFWKLGNK